MKVSRRGLFKAAAAVPIALTVGLPAEAGIPKEPLVPATLPMMKYAEASNYTATAFLARQQFSSFAAAEMLAARDREILRLFRSFSKETT